VRSSGAYVSTSTCGTIAVHHASRKDGMDAKSLIMERS
jgi:hypothetical protein